CNLFEWEGKYCVSMTVSCGEWTHANESIAMKIAVLPDFEKAIAHIIASRDSSIRDLTKQINRYYRLGFITALKRFF
ncbi:MAG: hypothetical protein WCG06_06920, partial [Candidatus Omnitrophota bacterium]